MSINWKDREVETKRQEVVVRALLNKWLEDNDTCPIENRVLNVKKRKEVCYDL